MKLRYMIVILVATLVPVLGFAAVQAAEDQREPVTSCDEWAQPGNFGAVYSLQASDIAFLDRDAYQSRSVLELPPSQPDDTVVCMSQESAKAEVTYLKDAGRPVMVVKSDVQNGQKSVVASGLMYDLPTTYYFAGVSGWVVLTSDGFVPAKEFNFELQAHGTVSAMDAR